MTENELKILMKETETREPTEEEIDKLRELFWEKYGQASYGMCLHPYWLLHNPFDELDIETIEYESEEVKAWLEQGTLDLFDEPEYEKPDPDIGILCDKPDECSSRKQFGNACKCIRENFRTQEDFYEWQEKKMSELKESILKIIE